VRPAFIDLEALNRHVAALDQDVEGYIESFTV
jgi:hypothetical protein